MEVRQNWKWLQLLKLPQNVVWTLVPHEESRTLTTPLHSYDRMLDAKMLALVWSHRPHQGEHQGEHALRDEFPSFPDFSVTRTAIHSRRSLRPLDLNVSLIPDACKARTVDQCRLPHNLRPSQRPDRGAMKPSLGRAANTSSSSGVPSARICLRVLVVSHLSEQMTFSNWLNSPSKRYPQQIVRKCTLPSLMQNLHAWSLG